MVRVYPFKSLISASSSCQLSNTDSHDAPHSFSSRSRSVATEQHFSEICLNAGANVQDEVETDLLRQTPVVVISRMSNKATEGRSNSPCDEHGITYQNVDKYIDGGILELVKERSFLIYSQETGGNHRQVGICAALAVEDCLKGIIKRHENVKMEAQSPKKAYQTPHLHNVDPVMIMYRRSDMITSIIDRITTSRCPVMVHSRPRSDLPLSTLNDDPSAAHSDDDKHKIWSVTDEEDIESIRAAFLQVKSLYIADGHHRTAAACRTSLQNKDNAGYRKASHTKYLLGFLFPHTHVRVIPYNRCVTDLGGRSSAEFLRLVSSVFDIKDHNSNSSSSNSGNMSSSSGSGSSDSDSDSSKSTNSSSHRISNTYSEYERRSLGVAALNESSSRLRGRGTVSLTESSLSLLPLLDSQFMLPKCNDYEKMSSKDKMFDCLDTAPCSSTDSDSIDSFDQYDLEGSECSVHVEGPPCPYYTSHNRLDSLERAALKGKRSTVAAASAPVGHKSRAHNTPIAQQQVYCEGIASMSECSDDAQQQQQHLILMYFQGRWLDLVPLDAVEENDSDPLSSLDIQILFERLLRPLLGIECPCSDKRIIHVCGNEGVQGLESRVDSKRACVAFRVVRVTVSDIMRVADAGQLMPPKATCFSPKPLCGLVIRLH